MSDTKTQPPRLDPGTRVRFMWDGSKYDDRTHNPMVPIKCFKTPVPIGIVGTVGDSVDHMYWGTLYDFIPDEGGERWRVKPATSSSSELNELLVEGGGVQSQAARIRDMWDAAASELVRSWPEPSHAECGAVPRCGSRGR